MQRKKIFFILFLSILISASSCSKDGNNGSNSEEYLTCKLNGKAYNFNIKVNANDKPAEKKFTSW
ncbi:hypothetical protein [Pedobacter mendelii]|uniref:Uncharacterized protein n=1 Tax=Pedobacter mendelii TaxID=1908240 RepID=A0ABQ2BN25_9SPHI|nr:hypothetical protein [Pedobacter mendelii]GGI28527.1 hypothetical protein GCM10008119_33090 [Pedobacter mendelii]